jgi:long-subunit acyl-CoA synthetase (AMP-forming)
MRNLLDSLPDNTALLSDGKCHLTRAILQQRIEHACAALRARKYPAAPVALLADNSPEWLAIDLATQCLGITLVPLPLFFTPAQWLHVIRQSGVHALFCPDADRAASLGFTAVIDCSGPLALWEDERHAPIVALTNVQKITFTSGTTSTPKGVCLSLTQQWEVAHALHHGLKGLQLRRHLCLLPFSVLLENIAGACTALLSGAMTICPPLLETGMSGASGFDPELCMATLDRYQPQSIILVPQMLQSLVTALRPGDPRIHSLRFVAVGGGKTSPRLLATARARGFPVHEGYGLSECGSVVALNLPGAEREGSVGRPLGHRPVCIAKDGEILVSGAIAPYLGQEKPDQSWLATGDLGHLDADGYLYVDGRKKDILITSYGRNVSPEWPEAALTGTGAIAQAMVAGDAQPFLAALIVPASPALGVPELQQAVDQANAGLPDYAQVRRWLPVAPFTAANGLATANGRPRRALIQAQYARQIASLFDRPEPVQ